MNSSLDSQIRRRIAVIDDDAVFVELMQDLLGDGEGYEVVSTAQWLQSVEFVKETTPDLVILDLMLGRDQMGWGVLDLLREEPSTKHIPVILCSAAAPTLPQRLGSASDDGLVETVAKPFDVDHMLQVIGRMLDQRPSEPSHRTNRSA